MTALEYMERQLSKNVLNYVYGIKNKSPEEQLQNIKNKIGYYEAAAEALKKGGGQ